MSEMSERFSKVASRFTDTVAAVPADGWANPTPCDGWVARDVVRHLVEWVPPFLASGAALELTAGPSVDADPLGAWTSLNGQLQAVLEDPEMSARQFEHPQAGSHRLDDAIGMFILGDVLVHTWDLARAVGLDDTLDANEAQRMVAGLEPLGDMLSKSGHYNAIVSVPADADTQTKLLALTGRQP